jgi:hypothetical protein
VRGQRHAPAAFYPRESPGNHCTVGWVGPRVGLDNCGKSRPHRDSIPDRPARSQSLYRLSYPAHGSGIIRSYLRSCNLLLKLLKTKPNLLYTRNQSVPTPVINNNQLMTYKAKVAVCSEIRTKHSTQSEDHVELLNVKPGGT